MATKTRINWEGNMTGTGKMRNYYKNFAENLRGRVHLGDLGIDETIILK